MKFFRIPTQGPDFKCKPAQQEVGSVLKVHGVQYLSPLGEEIHLHHLGRVCLHHPLPQVPVAISPCCEGLWPGLSLMAQRDSN